ncbi:MAG: hypothetical protein LBC70_11045, partial [Chitinispirillales bacterium]|nr:hypothetical protein [Chitinispirillales bacterium]
RISFAEFRLYCDVTVFLEHHTIRLCRPATSRLSCSHRAARTQDLATTSINILQLPAKSKYVKE